MEHPFMSSDEQPIEVHFIEGIDTEYPSDESEEGGLLSLTQVAEALGVSNPTARRLCMSGKLPAEKILVNEQLCWKVKAESLKAYQEALFDEAAAEDPAKTTRSKSVRKGLSEDGTPFTNRTSSDFLIEAHLTALETARRALERLERIEGLLEEQRDRAEQQRTRADQAERQKLSLELELRQYQGALAEQAESLAEMRAEKLAAEIRLEQTLALAPPDLPLKVSTPRPTFGQRIRNWLGLKAADG
jgi:hypothetical protein